MPTETKLKTAREQAGLSLEDVASRTKIQPHKLEALETGDFGNLPDGASLDGIVRAYAREVGIDPASVITRVRGERSTFAAMADIAPDGLDAFPSEGDTRVLAPRSPVKLDFSDEPIALPAVDTLVRATSDVPTRVAEVPDSPTPIPLSTLSTSVPITSAGEALLSPPLFVHEPPRPSRWPARLAILTLSLAAVVGWGAYFYETTYPFDWNAPASSTSMPTPAAPSDLSVLEPQSRPAEEGAAAGSTGVLDHPTPDASLPPPLDDAGVTLPPEPAPAAPTADSIAAKSRTGTNAPMPDVSGSWTLSTRVDRSSSPSFEHLEIGYEIHLRREGDRITGSGRKVSEYGNAIGSSAQTLISFSGTMSGNRLTLNFTEGGARSSPGKLVLLVDEDGAMRGRFSTSSAQSSGIVEALRVP